MPAPSPYFTYLTELLKNMLEKGASDLFVTVGAPPAIKLHGEMTPFNTKPISREQAEEILRAAMNEKQQAEFRDTRECNFALSLDGIGRFRVNAYVQRGSVGLVARHINTQIPTLMDLSLNLRGIVSQRLIPKINGGRVPAIEILLSSPLVSDLIHKGEVHEIKTIMAKSRDLGMRTFDQALYDLCAAAWSLPKPRCASPIRKMNCA